MLAMLSLMMSVSAQKIKGSRTVTLAPIETETFDAVEVSGNIEVFLIKADAASIEIEADDNLHDAISHNVSAGTLLLQASKEVTGFKKFSVKIFYTDNLKSVTAKEDSNVTATTDLVLPTLAVTSLGNAKFYATVKADQFTLRADDKAKIEMNLTAQNTIIELSKNASLKGLIATSKMTFDMYQKTTATIEGDVVDLKLRIDNNAHFTGKNLTAVNSDITAEGYSNCTITTSTNLTVDAGGKSEIYITGEPKITIKRFADSALLAKKPSK